MKKSYLLILLFIFISTLNAKTAREYITFEERAFWDWNSPQCYGSNSSLANDKIIVQLKDNTFGNYQSTYYTKLNSQSKFYNTKTYKGISCGTSLVYYPQVGNKYYIYYPIDNNDPELKSGTNAVYQRTKVLRIEKIVPCPTTPDNLILNGLAYQTIVSDDNTCKSIYNDNGDGLGYLYSNLTLNNSCDGFCYFNEPSEVDPNPTDPNPDPNNPDPTTPTQSDNDVTILIPYLDEVEEKNQTIIDTLEKINTTLNSNNEKNEKEELKSIGESFINPSDDNDISSELNDFDADIRSKLDDSFANYSNVFGLSGYGVAPEPIDFNLLGKSYRVFDIAYINSYIETIRNIFSISAYFLGLFLVFRGD